MTSVAGRRAPKRGSWTTFGVLAGYSGIAFLYFGLRVLIEPGRQYIGVFDDPQIGIWSFGWWLRSIEHGSNPFVTHVLWAPEGVKLVWVNTVPAVAIAFAPLTALFGPVASYDVAAVLMPALSAWTAFLLCRHVSGRVWPSVVGGYLFGFSSYELAHMLGQPQLTAAFAIPLVALVVVQAVEGSLGRRALITRLGLLLTLQVYLSTEVAFTTTVSLILGLILGFLLAPASRKTIRGLPVPLAGAYLMTAVLSLPVVYYAFADPRKSAFTPPADYTADLLNFVVPTRLEAIGGGWSETIARHFLGNITEQNALIGLPLLLIVFLLARSSWKTPRTRFLIASLALSAYLSLGPELRVDGHGLIPLPTFLGHESVTIPGVGSKLLPVFNNVLPARFAVFASLAGGVIAAIWMASTHTRVLKWLLPALAIIALVPNPGANVWATTFSVPAFFASSAYRSCLAPNENIMAEPISGGGQATLWQVEDAFRFRMAGGRLQTSPPSKFLHPPGIATVSIGEPMAPSQANLLRNYFRVKDVTTVVVDRRDISTWAPVLNRIAKPHSIGGVVVYRVPGRSPTRCPGSRS